MRKVLSMDVYKPDGGRDVQYMISEFMSEYDHIFYFQEFRFEKNNNTAFKTADEFYTFTEAKDWMDQLQTKYEAAGNRVVLQDWYTREIRSWT